MKPLILFLLLLFALPGYNTNASEEHVPNGYRKPGDPLDPGFVEPDGISIAYNTDPGAVTYSGASGGSGSFYYQWQSSPDNQNWSDISGATSMSYYPGPMQTTTYFRMHVMQTDQNDEGWSSSGAIYVYEPVVIGSVSPAQATVNYNGNPGVISFEGATGGDGFFEYQWQKSTDNNNWSDIPGATSLNYSPGSMKGTTFFRVMVNGASQTNYTNTATVTVIINPGVISPASQTIAYRATPASLTCTAANEGNAPFTYQWQSSIDNQYWNNINGANQLTYAPGSLFSTNYFRVKISDALQVSYTNTAIVTVNGSPGSPTLITGTGNNPINLSYPVGTSSGNLAHDGSGGVTYSIPIDVLRGSGGMEPSVSLVYNSRGGKGIAGYGWKLSAFSSISRTGKNNYFDGASSPVTYTNTADAFVLDGHRLFPISGTNGANATIYGQENEDFSKIQSFGGSETMGPDYFIITKKDGTVLEYGRNAEAKFLTDDGNSTIVWLLNKVTDRNHNYCTFVYNIDQSNRNYLLSEIAYTGNTATGLANYNKILFKYSVVANWQYLKKYLAGASMRNPYILDKIELVNSAGTSVKTYQCSYSTLNGDYFLREFSETGTGGTKYNPLQFTYGITTATPGVLVSNQFEGINFDFSGFSGKSYAGNFVGDGKAGYLTAYYQKTNGITQFAGYSINGGFQSLPYTSPQKEFGMSKMFPNYSHDIIGLSNTNIRNTNDYDGDGKTDVLFTSYYFDEEEVQRYTGTQINYTRYLSTGISYDSSVYSALPTSVDGGYAYDRVGQNGLYVVPGDFDGDGAQDYILVLGRATGPDYKMFFNSPKKGIVNKEIVEKVAPPNMAIASLLTYLYSSHVQAIDFDGDGKQDILAESWIITISKDNSVQGYEYSASMVYQDNSGFIGTSSSIYPGDFNGDGMSDLLVRYSTSINNNWRLFYSTGKEFKSYNFQFNYIPNISDYGDDQSADVLMVSDLNRDGKSDIWLSQDFNNSGTINSRHSLYLSQGEPTDPNNGTSAFILKVETSPVSIAFDSNHSRVMGDFDGDGKTDILITQHDTDPGGLVTPARIIFPRPLLEDFLLVKATNGVGKETDIIYDRLNTGIVTYSQSNPYDSHAGGPSQNAYNIFNNSSFVVETIRQPNGLGGTIDISYSYVDAVHHPLRGFLGFKKVTETNTSTNYASATVRDIDLEFLVPHVVNQYTYQINTSSQPIASATIFDDRIRIQPSNPLDKRFVYRVNKTLTSNEVSGTATESVNTYDNYNNVTANTTKKGVLVSGTVSPTETTTTTTIYGMHGTPVPASPETITITNTRSGQSAFSKTTDFTYDNAGNVLTIVDFSGKTKAITTTNTYDAFGNIKQQDFAASGVSTRTQKFTYDNTGRFLTQKEALGTGINQKTTYTYEPVLGNIATRTSSDGLTTTYTYDVFGRIATTTLPEGYIVTSGYNWENTVGRYAVSQTRPGGGSNVKIYYDLLGRELKKEVSGFNNGTLTSETSYDEQARVASTVAGHYSNEPAVTTSIEYDYLGRATEMSNGTVTKSFAYDKLSGGQFRVTTTRAGKSISRTQDAAGRIVAAADNGGVLAYTYNSMGKATQIALNGTIAVTSVYDDYGNQINATERNKGSYTYNYDAFHQLTQQTDALGNNTTFAYDLFGRIISRTGAEGTTTLEYWKDDANGYSNNSPSKVTGFSGELKEYTYDNLRRPFEEKVTVDGTAYVTQFQYDSYSNLTQTTYPSGLAVTRAYDRNGTETQVSTGSTTLFTATAMNSLGRYTQYSTGNGKSSTESFNLVTGTPTQYYTDGVQNLTFSFDDQTGNLLQRKDVLKNLQEDFTYDNLDRLLTTSLNNVQQQSVNYDGNNGNTLGNIVSKTDAGNYTYNSNKVNAVAYITNPAGAQTPPSVIPVTTQDISYTPFQKTQQVTDNNYGIEYIYGSGYERIKSVLKQNGAVVETKYYLGTMERQQKSGTTRDIHYINAGNGLCAIIVKESGATNIYYTYKDYLGSILTVTNSSGTVVAAQNFDAWGRKRNPDNGSYNNIPVNPDWLYRGYTAHEHLNEFGLINMNGRMYDPVQGRMMSPDALINDGYSTQSFNMYSYVMNNPLKFIDPTGFTFESWDEVNDAVNELWDSPFGGGYDGESYTYFNSNDEAFGWGVGYMNDFGAWGGGEGWAGSPEEALDRYNGGTITPAMVQGYYQRQWGGDGKHHNVSADFAPNGKGFNISSTSGPVGTMDNVQVMYASYERMAQLMGMGNGSLIGDINDVLSPFGIPTAGVEYQLGRALDKYNRLDQIKPYNQAWMLKNNPYLQTRTVNVEIPVVSRHIEVPRNVVKNVGTGLKVFGAATSVVSAANDINRYQNGEISGAHLTVNLIMNGVGFLGPVGTGVSILYGLAEDWLWSW
jgi:RHS repeat-associated protein